MAVLSHTVIVWSTNELWSRTLYQLPMLKLGKFLIFTLKISMKVTDLECQNTKSTQLPTAQKWAFARLSLTSGATISLDRKKKNTLSTISLHYAVPLLTDQRPLVFNVYYLSALLEFSFIFLSRAIKRCTLLTDAQSFVRIKENMLTFHPTQTRK